MSLLSGIKGIVPEKLKRNIKLLFVSSKDPNWIALGASTKQIVYIFLAGFYQNLGDLAITYAQRKFLERVFPEAEIVTVSSTNTYGAVKTIKRIIRPTDIVTIIGGGNMDDMYVSLEEARLHVVKSFPNNKIISFPQTFAFSDTDFGIKRQEISYKIYSRHRDLTIFVREPYSLERIKIAFPDVKIGYCPDIVLSLSNFDPKHERHGVLCCLRADKEQSIHSEQRERLIQNVKNEFRNVEMRDTVDVSLEDCTEERFEQTLERFWDMLRHKEFVITDRLHCMIFCVITGTPCVAIDNSNHKISGVFQAWLKNKIPYITYVDILDAENVLSSAGKLLETNYSIVRNDFSEEFAPLRKVFHEQ